MSDAVGGSPRAAAHVSLLQESGGRQSGGHFIRGVPVCRPPRHPEKVVGLGTLGPKSYPKPYPP
jgi:hypothetical protein